ncbi:MAG: aminotransferase class I/II-fold pyridoxal phosphate-dependent enzyme, partial [Burkholderiales bacterium]
MTASLLAGVEMAPRDPILGITEAFHADTSPNKINLGVGVYTDDAGKVPLLECVRRADRAILENPTPWSYLPIDGLAAYDKAVQALIFGPDSTVLAQGRGVTVQAIGGTGALKICADFLRHVSPGA